MSLFEIPQLFKHSKNFNLGLKPSSFQFQLTRPQIQEASVCKIYL